MSALEDTTAVGPRHFLSLSDFSRPTLEAMGRRLLREDARSCLLDLSGLEGLEEELARLQEELQDERFDVAVEAEGAMHLGLDVVVEGIPIIGTILYASVPSGVTASRRGRRRCRRGS